MQAVQLLTCIRFPERWQKEGAGLEEGMAYAPFVGVLIGAGLALSLAAGALIDIWLGALSGLFFWLGITGFLHADGLADLADGLGASHGDKDRLLEVMREPHIGSFGVLALALLISAKLILLMLILKTGVPLLALVLVPAWTRLGSLIWLKSLPPLGNGMAAVCREGVSPEMMVFWVVALSAVSLFLAPALLLAPLLLLAWRYFLKLKLQGVSGDCIGAGIEICEAGLLFLLVIIHA